MSTGDLASQAYDPQQRLSNLADRYRSVRRHSDRILALLRHEDCVIQSMPDASPIRWHLAHTTWFFETFCLKSFSDYRPADSRFEYLFNSYYNTVGDQFPRDRRGLLSRPTVEEIIDYRCQVDQQMTDCLQRESQLSERLLQIVELGLQHEQQHQELMLTDIKHVFSCNPIYPALLEGEVEATDPPACQWVDHAEGLQEIGHVGQGFSFDNESPRHRVFLEPFQLSCRLATNGELLEFIDDGGYQRPELWLSLGWSHIQQHGWTAPIYWIRQDGKWYEFTLGGLQPLNLSLPATHVSYYEADAFARWSGARLPSEAEWEVAAGDQPIDARSVADVIDDQRPPHPSHRGRCGDFHAMFGSVWQWTSSSYAAYPGYQPPTGALGEYNGKFMCNQYVLRGSSCVTPPDHARCTYRNFFPTDARWQFTGIRLAKS